MSNKKVKVDPVNKNVEDFTWTIPVNMGKKFVKHDDSDVEVEEDIIEQVPIFILKKEIIKFKKETQQQLLINIVNNIMDIYSDIKNLKQE